MYQDEIISTWLKFAKFLGRPWSREKRRGEKRIGNLPI